MIGLSGLILVALGWLIIIKTFSYPARVISRSDRYIGAVATALIVVGHLMVFSNPDLPWE